MRPPLFPLLEEWLPLQRWYAAKHVAPVVTDIQFRARTRLGEHAELLEAVVTDCALPHETLYYVPLIHDYDGVAPALPATPLALVGPWGEGRLVDAVPDLRFARHLLGGEVSEARVLAGEQSNTSVVCQLPGGPVIVKVLRVLHDGANPDADVLRRLSADHCPHVPRFVAATTGQWRRGGHPEAGHLSVVSEFIADGADGWQLACEAVEKGEDFDAAGLGGAVAAVHQALADIYGTNPPCPAGTPAWQEESAAGWRERADLAVAEVGELATWREAALAAFEAALAEEWGDRQRVHGDLHLGQALRSAQRGWILLDFEGEPLRPLAERVRADLALRDVAGVLRSLDYAAAGRNPGWVARHREAFLDGYCKSRPDPRATPALLRALEVDKAFYEARYEARNRPDWLHIPLGALEGLLGR